MHNKDVIGIDSATLLYPNNCLDFNQIPPGSAYMYPIQTINATIL